ncbi:MAG: DUF4258 domain-containing protein [Acidiferrobacterales bacterium]
MKLKFPLHFQDRMLERGIQVDHVKKAITNPDSKKKVFEGRLKVRKEIGSKTIVVVYYKDAFRDRKNEYIIITAYYEN